jgi:adenylyl-sulfate kinase
MTKGCTVWFTGLTAAGKTTVSQIVAERLRERGCRVEVLDGDEVRRHLSDGLGFTREDRDRNIRRIGYVCKLLTRNGVVAIAAAISPYRDVRETLRREIGDFVEVYVNCPLETCEDRDYKGIYKRARTGQIQHVAGLSDPYEAPTAPDVLLETHCDPPEACAEKVVTVLEEMGYVAPKRSPEPYTAEERAKVEKRLEDLGYI